MAGQHMDIEELTQRVCRRLKELRRRAGLSQQHLAARLSGTGRNWRQAVSRFELGHIRRPSLAFVIDYLRACRADMTELAQIIDQYTSQDPVWEERARQALDRATADLEPALQRRARYYDIGMGHRVGQGVRGEADIAKRVQMARGQARALAWHRVLNHRLNQEFSAMHLGASSVQAILLKTYARKVFAALRRLRKSRPVWRERALGRLDEWPARYRLEPGPFARIKAVVIEWFELEDRAGRFD